MSTGHKGKNHKMTILELRAALADRNLIKVAEATGLHHNTLIGIRSGKISNPQQRTVDVLSEYLK